MEIEIESGSEEVPAKEKKKYGKYSEWEVKHWADVLQEAEEIKTDSEKMKYVKMCLGESLDKTKKAISSIEDLRMARKELDSEEADDNE